MLFFYNNQKRWTTAKPLQESVVSTVQQPSKQPLNPPESKRALVRAPSLIPARDNLRFAEIDSRPPTPHPHGVCARNGTLHDSQLALQPERRTVVGALQLVVPVSPDFTWSSYYGRE